MSFPTDSGFNNDPFNSGFDSSPSYSGGCETLSPKARFLSTVLTSLIGSIITGISGGFLAAFVTAWISWFATLRILAVGVWFCTRAAQGHNLDGGLVFFETFFPLSRLKMDRAKLMQRPMFRSTAGDETVRSTATYEMLDSNGESATKAPTGAPPPYEPNSQFPSAPANASGQYSTAADPQYDANMINAMQQPRGPKTNRFAFSSPPPSILGWVGWIYAAVYFPIAQIMWFVANAGNGPSAGNIKLVRALGIAVTALSLTMDTKARYAVALEQRWGAWARRAFTWTHAISTLLLGIVAVVLLVLAVVQMPIPVFFVPAFLVFATIWMFGSFLLFPPIDGGAPPNSVPTFLAGLFMGIFCGAFTSAPAFASMNMASGDGATLGQYLGCADAEAWRKFTAIFP